MRIGTAGWSIPAQYAAEFSVNAKEVEGPGTHLERYSRTLNAVEINSSFYREHKASTYTKWAESVPNDFKFSVKLSRYFTQAMRLKETGSKLREVLQTSQGLGKKWEVLLVQLPPSLEFVPRDVEKFIIAIRKEIPDVQMVWEPRHQSFRSLRAIEIFSEHEVAKVLADPEKVYVPRKIRTKVQSMIYARLHGTPEIYKSSYSDAFLKTLHARFVEVAESGKKAWCIFDNTTFGHATGNALTLSREFI